MVLAIGATFILIVLLVNHRKTHYLQQKIERLQHELSVANNGAMGMGQQLIQLEKKLQVTQRKTGSPELRVIENPFAIEGVSVSARKDSEEKDPHEISRTLLKQGVSIEETARRSGLSFSEVSLINAMSQSQ